MEFCFVQKCQHLKRDLWFIMGSTCIYTVEKPATEGFAIMITKKEENTENCSKFKII